MKIFLIINALSNSGGTERVISMLANDWSAENEVTIITMNREASFFPINTKIKVIGLDGGLLSNWLRIRKIVFEQKPDVIISASLKLLNIFMGSIYFTLNTKNIIKIAAEHISYQSAGVKINTLKRLFYKKFNYISVLTEHDKEIMKSTFKNVVVIQNPSPFSIDNENNSKDGYDMNYKTIAVGRLTYQKGFDDLLIIWSQLDRKLKEIWSLDIVGNGEDEQNLKQLAATLEISDSVNFVKPTKDILSNYRQSNIYLMTSRFEGLPMVLIEAKTLGLPCIAFDCQTGPAEIIHDSEDGFLIPEGDNQKFVERLEQLMRDPVLLDKMSRTSSKYAERYSISSVREQWFKLFSGRKINV
ncbi:glycosyltransferase family 4 protein [Rahnella victoriana]|uniref:glycosyltransferase family 4 protein n=1 Tax=Rahnella victoriana TaxID=1510570 RepID=UPI001E54BB8E|nr:glycosyltransferase family 4 protein [Rahnella victoriana]UHM89924.1 glycosyltransferase family 4 protein [Rahnella victoriana]